MLLSEDNARARWCPFVRVHENGCNRISGRHTPDVHTTCIGGNCMAWRWAGWETDFNTVAPAPPDDTKIGPRLGYCGLASKPYRAV